MAWRFFTIWLIYGLIIRPACDDRANNQLGSSVQLTSVDAEILAFFAPDLAALFNEIDPEYTLISIAAKFDLCKSFHERMAYKSLAGRHLGRVCDVLCELFSISSLTDDQQAGLDATHIPNCSRETLCSIGFHAASLLIRHCAVLLYTPMVGDANGSSLEQVITAFFLPRQLYELSKFRSTSHLTNIEEGLLLSALVIECMRDKLPDFTNGLSQLSWRSDTYVARIIRDSIRLYYKHLGGACIAMAVLNSPPDFRTHLLQLVVQEAVAEIGSNAQELDSQVMVQYVNKWLTFAKQIHRETHSAEAHQRDAPFIVWPLLNAFGSSNFCNRARSDVKQDARKLMTEYKQAVKNVKTVELREEIRRHCESLHQKSTKNTDLIHFFEI